MIEKFEIKEYIKDSFKNYTSNFADMDMVEDSMFKLKESKFIQLTKPKDFWVTFMEGEAAQMMQ